MTLLLIALLSLCQPCNISATGLEFIQRYEGYMPFMYQDAVGYWTIGYGHLMSPDEIEQYKGVTLTKDEVDEMFRKDMAKFDATVNRLVAVPLRQGQYDAVVSFTFNVGSGNFQRSTLRRKLNLELHNEVPPEFPRWNRAGGKVLRGLTLRRNAEAKMYEQATEISSCSGSSR